MQGGWTLLAETRSEWRINDPCPHVSASVCACTCALLSRHSGDLAYVHVLWHVLWHVRARACVCAYMHV
eukprot:11202076-Alexandrium_andersonii.AAC.1